MASIFQNFMMQILNAKKQREQKGLSPSVPVEPTRPPVEPNHPINTATTKSPDEPSNKFVPNEPVFNPNGKVAQGIGIDGYPSQQPIQNAGGLMPMYNANVQDLIRMMRMVKR